MSNWYVQIISFESAQNDDPRSVKTMGPMSEHNANKVDSGTNRNLNHDRFFTRMCQENDLLPEADS